MLTQAQIDHFQRKGYLIVEDLIDERTIEAVRKEYADLMDRLYAAWHVEGVVNLPPKGLSFWSKLEQCYKADFDWYQPFDISLPHNDIRIDTTDAYRACRIRDGDSQVHPRCGRVFDRAGDHFQSDSACAHQAPGPCLAKF